jgi:hypothetical protein
VSGVDIYPDNAELSFPATILYSDDIPRCSQAANTGKQPAVTADVLHSRRLLEAVAVGIFAHDPNRQVATKSWFSDSRHGFAMDAQI